ncbi:MAG: antirestriction protein ArdA [Pseudomonadota bacterium]
MSQPITPRVYVADLAVYNAGRLHGVWIDATEDVEAMLEEVQAMLDASPEPTSGEYAIHDTDGFEGIRIDEWASLETVHKMALFVIEHGRPGAALVDYCCNDVEEAKRLFEDGCYLGAWESTADYAQDLMEQTTEIPDRLAMYVDYQAMARDMELNGDIFTIEVDGEIHIFMNG